MHLKIFFFWFREQKKIQRHKYFDRYSKVLYNWEISGEKLYYILNNIISIYGTTVDTDDSVCHVLSCDMFARFCHIYAIDLIYRLRPVKDEEHANVSFYCSANEVLHSQYVIYSLLFWKDIFPLKVSKEGGGKENLL